MRPTGPVASAIALAILSLATPSCDHEHDHDHPAARQALPEERLPDDLFPRSPAHGGLVTRSGQFVLETVYRKDSVRVHASDRLGRPFDLAGCSGEVVIEFRDPARAPLTAPLAYVAGPGPDAPEAGGFVEARLDLSEVAEGAARGVFRIRGPGAELVYRRIVRFALDRSPPERGS